MQPRLGKLNREHLLTPEQARPEFESGKYDDELLSGEGPYMRGGQLVKARFPDRPKGTQVMWHWLPKGNCQFCQFYRGSEAPCARGYSVEDIKNASRRTDCDDFEAGSEDQDEAAIAQAAGLMEGKPAERVEVLQSVPWSPWASFQAHEQEAYLAPARQQAAFWHRNYPGQEPPWDMALDDGDQGDIDAGNADA